MDDIGTVIVSGDLNTLGVIQNVNYKFCSFFNYNKLELIKSSINLIIPQPLASQHNNFILRYLETAKKHVLDKLRVLMAVNALGFLFPIMTLSKLVPNLTESVRFIALVKKIPRSYKLFKTPDSIYEDEICFLLTNQQGIITAISKSSLTKLGIPLSLTYSNKFNAKNYVNFSQLQHIDTEKLINITAIIKDFTFENYNLINQMKSFSGVKMTMNTKSLRNAFDDYIETIQEGSNSLFNIIFGKDAVVNKEKIFNENHVVNITLIEINSTSPENIHHKDNNIFLFKILREKPKDQQSRSRLFQKIMEKRNKRKQAELNLISSNIEGNEENTNNNLISINETNEKNDFEKKKTNELGHRKQSSGEFRLDSKGISKKSINFENTSEDNSYDINVYAKRESNRHKSSFNFQRKKSNTHNIYNNNDASSNSPVHKKTSNTYHLSPNSKLSIKMNEFHSSSMLPNNVTSTSDNLAVNNKSKDIQIHMNRVHNNTYSKSKNLSLKSPYEERKTNNINSNSDIDNLALNKSIHHSNTSYNIRDLNFYNKKISVNPNTFNTSYSISTNRNLKKSKESFKNHNSLSLHSNKKLRQSGLFKLIDAYKEKNSMMHLKLDKIARPFIIYSIIFVISNFIILFLDFFISVYENQNVKNKYNFWYKSSERNVYLSSLYLSVQNLLILENSKTADDLYSELSEEYFKDDTLSSFDFSLNDTEIVSEILRTRKKIKYDINKVLSLSNELLMFSDKIEDKVLLLLKSQNLDALILYQDYKYKVNKDTVNYLLDLLQVKSDKFSLEESEYDTSDKISALESLYLGLINEKSVVDKKENCYYGNNTNNNICYNINDLSYSIKLENLKDLFYPAILNSYITNNNEEILSIISKHQTSLKVSTKAKDKLRDALYIFNNYCFTIVDFNQLMNSLMETSMSEGTSYSAFTAFLTPIFYLMCLFAFIIFITELIRINFFKLKIMKVVFLLNKNNGESIMQIANLYLKNIKKALQHKNPDNLLMNDLTWSAEENNPGTSINHPTNVNNNHNTNLSYHTGNKNSTDNVYKVEKNDTHVSSDDVSLFEGENSTFQKVKENIKDDIGYSTVLEDTKINEIIVNCFYNSSHNNNQINSNNLISTNNYNSTNIQLISQSGTKVTVKKHKKHHNSKHKHEKKNSDNLDLERENSPSIYSNVKSKKSDPEDKQSEYQSETASYIPAFVIRKKQIELEEKLENILENEINNTRSEIKNTLWWDYFKIFAVMMLVIIIYTIKFSLKLKNDNSLSSGNKYKSIVSQRALNFNSALVYYGKFMMDLNYLTSNNNKDIINYNQISGVSSSIESQTVSSSYVNYEETNELLESKNNALKLFNFYVNQTEYLENQILLLKSGSSDSILKNFLSFEDLLNKDKNGLCQILMQNEEADFNKNFNTDCYTKTDTSSSTGLRDGINQIINYLKSNFNSYSKQIQTYVKDVDDTIYKYSYKQLLKDNKKIQSSLSLLFKDKILNFNDMIQYYLNPAVLLESQTIYNSIIKFINQTYQMDYIISPISWSLLVLVFLCLVKIFTELKSMLNTDKTILFFIPAEMYNESEKVTEAVKELKEYETKLKIINTI